MIGRTLTRFAQSHAVVNRIRGGSHNLFSTANPLLLQEYTPRFQDIKPEDVKPAIQELLMKLETDFAKLESDLSGSNEPSYSSAIEAMEAVEAPVEYAWVRKLQYT
jgi:Zn-dependent oligopeptidase